MNSEWVCGDLSSQGMSGNEESELGPPGRENISLFYTSTLKFHFLLTQAN